MLLVKKSCNLSQSTVSPHRISINNFDVDRFEHTKFLGVMIDQKLAWAGAPKRHVNIHNVAQTKL